MESKAVKRLLKSYDFATIEEYFNYIIESQINGNFTQVKSLFIELPRVNRKDFLLCLVAQIENENPDKAAHYYVLKACLNIIY